MKEHNLQMMLKRINWFKSEFRRRSVIIVEDIVDTGNTIED